MSFVSSPGRPVGLGLLVRCDVVDGLPDGMDLLRVLVRDLDPELVFELHDQLHEIERVGVQVLLERGFFGDLVLIHPELFRQDFLDPLEHFLSRCRHCHLTCLGFRSAPSTTLIVPSVSFSITLPVKPSQTTTSAAPSRRLRLSVLPRKSRPSAAASSSCASSVSWFPFSGSSPIESSRTSGFGTSRISCAKTEPMYANWSRCSARPSAFAPASIRTVGRFSAGITTAIAGRATPGSRRSSRKQAASTAPVFPAETTASACFWPTARHAATSELSGLALTASAGFSSISISCVVSTYSNGPVSRPARPKSTGSMPSEAASSAPATTSSGARSPPITSTAILLNGYGVGVRSGS